MPYKTNSLAKTLDEIDEVMIRLKAFAVSINNQMAAVNVDADYVINIRQRCLRDKATLQSLASTPGLVQYAKDQKNDQAYDIGAAYTSVVTAIDNLAAGIVSAFPKDGSNYLLERQFSATGVTIREFTPAQTSGLRTLVSAISAAIE